MVDDIAAQVDDPDMRSKHHRLMRVRHRTSFGRVVQGFLVAAKLPGRHVHAHNTPGAVSVVGSVGVPSVDWSPVHKKVRWTRSNSHPFLPGWGGGIVGPCLESPELSRRQRLTAPPYFPGKRPGTNQETLEGKRKMLQNQNLMDCVDRVARLKPVGFVKLQPGEVCIHWPRGFLLQGLVGRRATKSENFHFAVVTGDQEGFSPSHAQMEKEGDRKNWEHDVSSRLGEQCSLNTLESPGFKGW